MSTQKTLQTDSSWADALAAVPLFKSLDESDMNLLSGLLREVSFAADEAVFRQGDAGDAMYIVRSGRVRIWTRDEDTKPVTLAEIPPGGFFGELAVLDGGQRSASATVIEESVLLRLAQNDFKAFMLAHPGVALDMIEVIGSRLRATNALVSKRITRNINEEMDEAMTWGERIADRVATFGGSWTFIILFLSVLAVWISVNVYLVLRTTGKLNGQEGGFDPYPFIALNLLLSMMSAFQAPIIMMSQNRSALKDRLAAENDYKINLKSEMMLEDLTLRMNRLQDEQVEELLQLSRRLSRLEESSHVEARSLSPDGGRAAR